MRHTKYTAMNTFLKLLMAPFALITVGAMRLSKQLTQFKLFEVYKHRMRHFALETELAALKSKYDYLNGKKTTTIFYFPDQSSANHHLEVVFRR